MKPIVMQNIARPEYYSDEGCFISELLNDERSPEVSMAIARVEPGKSTERHRLRGIADRYVIVAGEGWVEVGESLSEKVGPGDAVLIPPDCAQRIHNRGQVDLIFHCVCTPRFRAECYERF